MAKKPEPEEIEEGKKPKYRPLHRMFGQNDGDGTGYPGDDDRKGAQSEVARQLFDFGREKLKQRTILNDKQIITFANMFTQLAALDEDDPRPLPEVWMENLMELQLSNKGILRNQALAAFQSQAEESEMEQGPKL